jgi:hypothetical protein
MANAMLLAHIKHVMYKQIVKNTRKQISGDSIIEKCPKTQSHSVYIAANLC